MSASTVASTSAWEGLRHRFGRQSRHDGRGRDLRRDVRLLRLHAAGGAQLQRHQHGVEQGRAARARGDGADAAGADRRHRPVGRHHLPAHQLPRLQHRRRRSDHDDAGRHRRVARGRRLRCAQRRDRGLRAPAADHRDDRDQRALLWSRADTPAAARRLDQSGPRRPDDALDLLGAVFADHPSGCGAVHLDPVPALGHRPCRLRHRLIGTGGVYVGRRHRQGETPCLYAGGPSIGDCRPAR